MWTTLFSWADAARRMRGEALAACGYGAAEQDYRVPVAADHWRLREYESAGDGPPVLIIAAPIKRPYVWDLAPSASAILFCLRHGLRVFLLEWRSQGSLGASAGLGDYANGFIGEAVRAVLRRAKSKPFLAGHSLGGTLAAIHGAIEPDCIQGLVLLSAPLCFQPGSSRFRDAIVRLIEPSEFGADLVPGALVSQLSALACPDAFVWSRLRDAVLSAADPHAIEIHARIERWALDEVPLSGRLFRDILELLYRENRFCSGSLRIRGVSIGPSTLRSPMLTVVNAADEIAPAASVDPFLAALPKESILSLRHAGEIGVGLQHLAVLVGREAHARIWPKIIAWLRARA